MILLKNCAIVTMTTIAIRVYISHGPDCCFYFSKFMFEIVFHYLLLGIVIGVFIAIIPIVLGYILYILDGPEKVFEFKKKYKAKKNPGHVYADEESLSDALDNINN